MTNSNPASRTPSRNQPQRPVSASNNHHHPPTPQPGILAVSSAMMANANQSQNGANKNSSKRGKSSSSIQRRNINNASSQSIVDLNTSIEDLGDSKSEQVSSLTASTISSPSPSKRRGKKQSNKSAVSTGGYNTSDADEQLVNDHDGSSLLLLAGQDNTLADSPARNTRSGGSVRSRPKHRRGISSSNLTLTTSADADRAAADLLKPAPHQRFHTRPEDIDTDLASATSSATLSKSAPASSFLEGAYATRKNGGNGKLKNNNNNSNSIQQDKHQSQIRSSNSADEWEMPSVGLIKGNDVLTWQQQAALTRKGSQGKKGGKSTSVAAFNPKKQPAQANQIPPHNSKHKQSNATPPSGIAQSIAANAANEDQASQVSPTLTWQQALLQRSAPATPASSKIFDALEEGHSGARPASDHHRTRSSPAKPRPNTRLAQQQQQQQQTPSSNPGSEDDSGLDKHFDKMSLTRSQGAAAAKSGTKKAKPIPIHPTGPSYQRSQVEQDGQASPFQSAATTATATTAVSAPVPAKPTAIASVGSVSPTKATALYAGPKFHNSPHAGALPTPKLAAFLNRNRESSPVTSTPPTSGAIFA